MTDRRSRKRFGWKVIAAVVAVSVGAIFIVVGLTFGLTSRYVFQGKTSAKDDRKDVVHAGEYENESWAKRTGSGKNKWIN